MGVPQAEQNAARSAKTVPQLKQFGIDSARFGAAYTVLRKASTSAVVYAMVRITKDSWELGSKMVSEGSVTCRSPNFGKANHKFFVGSFTMQ